MSLKVFARPAWILAVAGLVPSPLLSQAVGSNGQAPRPFYNFAHNPNEISNIQEALDAGANALEPDLMRFADGAEYYAGVKLNDTAQNKCTADPTRCSGLYVYHDHVLVTSRNPATLEEYLEAAHALMVGPGHYKIALIVLDTKDQAATWLAGEFLSGNPLTYAVKHHLNYDGVDVKVIYSVASYTASDYIFDYICLGPHEGIQLDEPSDNDFFNATNVLAGHLDHRRRCRIDPGRLDVDEREPGGAQGKGGHARSIAPESATCMACVGA